MRKEPSAVWSAWANQAGSNRFSHDRLPGAQWCSADPVCMEMGRGSGQGPDSLNLAACHGCCLVPETACEEFNRLLDRGLLIGPFDNPEIGFFNTATEG